MDKNRIISLDLIKIISTCLILLHHFDQFLGKGLFYGGGFYFGRIVELFFMISGILSYKYIKKDKDHISSFSGDRGGRLLDKWLRFVPMVAFYNTMCAILVGIYYIIFDRNCIVGGFNLKRMVSIAEWVKAILGLEAGWFNSGGYSVSWYVSVLLLCISLLWLADHICAKLDVDVEVFCVIMIFAGICLSDSSALDMPLLNSQAARGYWNFFAGVMLMSMNEKGILKKIPIMIPITTTLVSPILFWALIRRQIFDYRLLNILFYPSCLIIALRIKLGFSRRLDRIVTLLSDMSYDVYLLQMPLIILLGIMIKSLKLDLNTINNVYGHILFVLASFTLGGLIYSFVDKPFTKKCKQIFDDMEINENE